MERGRDQLLEAIIDCELEMFLATVNRGGPAACQQNPDMFRLMRWMNHSVHEDATLRVYLEDLTTAKAEGRNVMTEKYARMENLLPPLSDHPAIALIAETENAWRNAAKQIYPLSMRGRDQEDFQRYRSCELETFSDATLECFLAEIENAQATGRNLAEERYENLWKRLGWDSLAAHEAAARAKEEQ